MNPITGRFTHIEDVLCALHTNSWYGWSDSKNKVYANLVIHEKYGEGGKMVDNPHSKPTEKFLTDALAKAQKDHDDLAYARARYEEYPRIGDQLDMIYKDNLNGTTTHKDAVETVKTKWPKDNSGPIE